MYSREGPLVFISQVEQHYQFVTRVHIILFHTQINEFIPDDKNEEHHSSSPCLTRSAYVLLVTSQSVADDVTITRRLWRDHVKSDI